MREVQMRLSGVVRAMRQREIVTRTLELIPVA
jgi:hypothetical protein